MTRARVVDAVFEVLWCLGLSRRIDEQDDEAVGVRQQLFWRLARCLGLSGVMLVVAFGAASLVASVSATFVAKGPAQTCVVTLLDVQLQGADHGSLEVVDVGLAEDQLAVRGSLSTMFLRCSSWSSALCTGLGTPYTTSMLTQLASWMLCTALRKN